MFLLVAGCHDIMVSGSGQNVISRFVCMFSAAICPQRTYVLHTKRKNYDCAKTRSTTRRFVHVRRFNPSFAPRGTVAASWAQQGGSESNNGVQRLICRRLLDRE